MLHWRVAAFIAAVTIGLVLYVTVTVTGGRW